MRTRNFAYLARGPLVQVMACNLLGTVPLPKQVMKIWPVETIAKRFVSKYKNENTLQTVLCILKLIYIVRYIDGLMQKKM